MATTEIILHENIEKLDKEVLVTQNSFLQDELNKYRGLERRKASDTSELECHCVLKFDQYSAWFKSAFELFNARLSSIASRLPENKNAQGLLEFLKASFLSLEHISQTASKNPSKETTVGDLASKFEVIVEGLLADFEAGHKAADFHGKEGYVQRIGSLEKANAELLTQVTSLTAELESLKTLTANGVSALKGQIDEALWKKHLLEKRLNALRSLFSKKADAFVKEMSSSPFYYCYCGGRFLENLSIRVSPEFHNLLTSRADTLVKSFYNRSFDPLAELNVSGVNRTPTYSSPDHLPSPLVPLEQIKSKEILASKPLDAPSKQAVPGKEAFEEESLKDDQAKPKNDCFHLQLNESQLKDQIQLMQQEIKELFDLAERRRVDKLSIIRNFMATNFFQKLMKAHKSNLEQIEFLEKKVEDASFYISELESLRKQELFELKEKDHREKEKLVTQINLLRREIDGLKQRTEGLKSIKERTASHSPIAESQMQSAQEPLVVSLQSKLDLLIKTAIPNLEEKLKARDARILAYEQELDNIRNSSIDQRIFNAEFRHKLHSSIFGLIREQVNPQTLEKIKELEKYVKIREEKIRDLDKTIKQLTKENASEKQQSSALLEEIARSSETFTELQTMIHNLKSEVNNANQNFNALFKERQAERTVLEAKVADLEIEVSSHRDHLSTKSQQIELLRGRLAELEYQGQLKVSQIKEVVLSLDEMAKDKAHSLNKIATLEAELETASMRSLAQEKSLEKFSAELSDSFTRITQKDVIIKQLLERISQSPAGDQSVGEPNLKSSDLSLYQKQEYLLSIMELKKLRVR